ncbi:hypothetical protein pb186bvf_017408 [Paramecium bursaria]
MHFCQKLSQYMILNSKINQQFLERIIRFIQGTVKNCTQITIIQ